MAHTTHQSALRYPLTAILGTEAHVRLLRELSRHGGQLSSSELAARTGLSRTSVWSALGALTATGTVTVAGSGRALLYSLKPDGPLRPALDVLFEAEEARFASIIEELRSAAKDCGAAAAWIYGSVARGLDRFGSDLDVAVVTSEEDPSDLVDAFRERLDAFSEALGFTPSVVSISPTDIARLVRECDPWWTEVVRDAFAVLGPRPEEMAGRALADGRETMPNPDRASPGST